MMLSEDTAAWQQPGMAAWRFSLCGRELCVAVSAACPAAANPAGQSKPKGKPCCNREMEQGVVSWDLTPSDAFIAC